MWFASITAACLYKICFQLKLHSAFPSDLIPSFFRSDPVEAKHFSANIIVEGTPRAVKSRRQKFTKDDLDNLQSVINRRRVAAGYYSARGEQYLGA